MRRRCASSRLLHNTHQHSVCLNFQISTFNDKSQCRHLSTHSLTAMIRVPPTTSRNLLSCLYSQSSSSSPSLAGTVPFHDCYVFLHTRKPPTSYPGRVKSPLQRSLQLLALQWGGIINFSWSPEQPTLAAGSISEVAEWEGGDQEAYRATAFSRFNGKLELPEVNLRNLEEINSLLSTHANPRSPPSDYHSPDPALHLYVCIHGERDCRCGDTGGKVFDALRREVTDRGLSGKVEVAGVGHVGGHKLVLYHRSSFEVISHHS